MSWTHFLCVAMEEGALDMIASALQAGADPNAADDMGDYWTPMMNAACQGDPAIVRLLLDHGGSPGQAPPGADSTPFHCAAEKGDVPILEMFLPYAGREVLGKLDYLGHTPLGAAVGERHIEAVRFLLAAGSKPDAHGESALRTPLGDAVEGPDVDLDIVRALLDAGADPRTRAGFGYTALDHARARKRPPGPEIVEWMEAAIRKLDG